MMFARSSVHGSVEAVKPKKQEKMTISSDIMTSYDLLSGKSKHICYIYILQTKEYICYLRKKAF